MKLKLQFKLPYQIFPGIFSSIDSYSKKITLKYFEKYGKLPPWFNQFGNFEKLIPVPHWSKFFLIDEETNIKLTGVADEILQKDDGSYCIVDYKTAKFTEAQDNLFPMYRVQLNSYAAIAERIGISPVSGVGLIYYEPETSLAVDQVDEVLLDRGFEMGFEAHCVKVELSPEGIVLPLLREVRRLGELGEAPEENSDCSDCQLVEELAGLVKRS